MIGLPQSGKTSLFQLLTERSSPQAALKTERVMVRIPDKRVDFLSNLYRPRKVTYAQVEIADVPGLVPGSEKEAAVFLQAVRDADALIYVVRAFFDETVPHIQGKVDPVRDIELIDYELLIADLDLVEKRIERIQQGKKKNERELAWLCRVRRSLEEEMPLSKQSFLPEEEPFLKTYQFLTSKPVLVVLNVGDKDLQETANPFLKEVQDYVASRNVPVLAISAKLEAEIAELEDEERKIFLEDLGVEEPGIVRLAQAAYKLLGLISFFTVGEDEVKAWTIAEGTTARKAAGKIHSDMERGFIRAEVVKFSDLYECGNMARVREKGLFRLEGKDYVVQDGDIIHFRFNV